MSKEEIIRKKSGNKKPFHHFEKTFNSKAQLQAYIVDRMSTNRNKRFNMKIILT